MNPYSFPEMKFDYACHLCRRRIEYGEEVVTVVVSVETAREDKPEGIGHVLLSCLCLRCAATTIADKVMGKKPVPPSTSPVNLPETTSSDASTREKYILIDAHTGDKLEEAVELSAHCRDDGFFFHLNYLLRSPYVASRVFTWKQVFQLLLAACPNMFSDSDPVLEPTLLVDTLQRLGYNHPHC